MITPRKEHAVILIAIIITLFYYVCAIAQCITTGNTNYISVLTVVLFAMCIVAIALIIIVAKAIRTILEINKWN